MTDILDCLYGGTVSRDRGDNISVISKLTKVSKQIVEGLLTGKLLMTIGKQLV